MRASTLVALALVAGCRSGNGHAGSVIVDVFAGDRVAPDVTVVSHTPSGQLVDFTTADPAGRADIDVDADSLVSVIFPAQIAASTPVISVITTVPPTDHSELAVHGPVDSRSPPLVVGILRLDGPALAGATYFDVTLGCTTVRVASLPATIDVASCNMGTDQNLDILVRGYHDIGGDPPAPILDGYGAGRVAMTDGVAMLAVTAWETTGAPVAISGLPASLDWTMHVDGLDFVDEPMGATSHAYTGLQVDSTSVHAAMPSAHGAVITTTTSSGVPTSVVLAADDFLPPLDVVPAMPTLMHAEWGASPSGGDALNLHASWTNVQRVVWDAILPPDATSVTLPDLGGDYGAAINPTSILPTDIVLRAIDSSALDGFAAVRAAGIRAEETLQVSPIVDETVGGQVRVAQSIGSQ